MTECSGVDIQAVPIAEQIDAVILTRLRNITVDNGYQFDASEVRWIDRSLNAYEPQPRAIWVEQENETRNDELSCPGNPPADAYDRSYIVNGYARQLDEDGHQIETVDRGVSESQMIAAMQKAITDNNASGWQSFGGLAMNASMTATETFDAPGYDGGRVLLMVQYRISAINPFEGR